MKVNLIRVLIAASIVLSTVYVLSMHELRQRTVPNVSFKLNRQIDKSNPSKDELMHVFSNMGVPWWGKLYA